MLNEIILVAGQTAVVAVLALIGALVFRRSFNLRWLVIALAVYVLYDFLLTRGFYLIPHWPAEANWNWLGKFMSLGGMLAVAALPMFAFERAGITLKQKPGWPLAFIALIPLTAFYLYFALSANDGPDDLETIAFQWTMPGFDEEVFYRGVLLLAMNEAFRARVNVLGAPIGYGGLLTCVVFGLAHAMGYGADGFSFEPVYFLLTGVPSFLLLWMRERTGSIVLPIVAHNIANGISTLI
jgi:membrane protease YdiL (CAAX protease family)